LTGIILQWYVNVGTHIEHGNFREALDTMFGFVRTANIFFDEEQPWITVKSNPEKCKETLNTCIQIIANLSLLLEPFLPFSSARIRKILKIENTSWRYIEIPAGTELNPAEILFERIDKKTFRKRKKSWLCSISQFPE